MYRTFENNFGGCGLVDGNIVNSKIEKRFYFYKTLDNGNEIWMDEIWAYNNPDKITENSNGYTDGIFKIPFDEKDFSNGIVYSPRKVSNNGEREVVEPGHIVSFIW